jgi:hypothetical protein
LTRYATLAWDGITDFARTAESKSLRFQALQANVRDVVATSKAFCVHLMRRDL